MLHGAYRPRGHDRQALAFATLGMGHPLGPVGSELSFSSTAWGPFPPQRVLLTLCALHSRDPARLHGVLSVQLHPSVSVSESLSLSLCLCLTLRPQVLRADFPCPPGVITAHLENPLGQFKAQEKSFRGFLRASCCPV